MPGEWYVSPLHKDPTDTFSLTGRSVASFPRLVCWQQKLNLELKAGAATA